MPNEVMVVDKTIKESKEIITRKKLNEESLKSQEIQRTKTVYYQIMRWSRFSA